MSAVAQAWTCRKCGSTERRTTSTGCAACHRAASIRSNGEAREARDLAQRDDLDIEVTPAMRAYLRAFDAYLMAGKTGDLKARRLAKSARRRALEVLEGPA